jgi:aryl-alcohol dehydrogenase-like predicted oxidoreductase
MQQQQRKLGRSDISITPLVLGGNVFGWTADEAASYAILDAFVELGGNALDTADVYSAWAPGHQGGESEAVIGRWLKRSGKRNKVVIGTKVGLWPKRPGVKRANIVAACEDSLSRLGVDAIDLYWLHRDDEATDPEEFVSSLEELKRAGKIRAFGASNFKPGRFAAALAEAARHGAHFEALQPEYNLMNREIESEMLPLCDRAQVSVLPYYALANGYLTGKYRTEADKKKSPRGGRVGGHMQGKGPAVLGVLDAIAAHLHATDAQVALAWVMAKCKTGAPIASATNVAQLRELMGALDIKLALEDIAALDQASA